MHEEKSPSEWNLIFYYYFFDIDGSEVAWPLPSCAPPLKNSRLQHSLFFLPFVWILSGRNFSTRPIGEQKEKL